VTVGRKRDQVKPNRKKRVNLRVSSLPHSSAAEVRVMPGKPCGAWVSGGFRARNTVPRLGGTSDGYSSVTRITHCDAFIAVGTVLVARLLRW
jgi:hypothetical protein